MNSKKEHYVNDVCPKCKHFIGFTKGRCPCYEQGRQEQAKDKILTKLALLKDILYLLRLPNELRKVKIEDIKKEIIMLEKQKVKTK